MNLFFFVQLVVSLPCCCHSAQLYCRWIGLYMTPSHSLLKEHPLCVERDCRHLGSIMILFFHLLFSDIHHHHVNLSSSWSATFAKSTQWATHESWITITLAHAVTSISLCFLTGNPHSSWLGYSQPLLQLKLHWVPCLCLVVTTTVLSQSSLCHSKDLLCWLCKMRCCKHLIMPFLWPDFCWCGKESCLTSC